MCATPRHHLFTWMLTCDNVLYVTEYLLLCMQHVYCSKTHCVSVCIYSTSSYRKDKSRINAQSRRTTHAHLLKELGSLLPFPEKVVQQIDYNSILRLVLCYFRMKNLAIQNSGSCSPKAISMCMHYAIIHPYTSILVSMHV